MDDRVTDNDVTDRRFTAGGDADEEITAQPDAGTGGVTADRDVIGVADHDAHRSRYQESDVEPTMSLREAFVRAATDATSHAGIAARAELITHPDSLIGIPAALVRLGSHVWADRPDFVDEIDDGLDRLVFRVMNKFVTPNLLGIGPWDAAEEQAAIRGLIASLREDGTVRTMLCTFAEASVGMRLTQAWDALEATGETEPSMKRENWVGVRVHRLSHLYRLCITPGRRTVRQRLQGTPVEPPGLIHATRAMLKSTIKSNRKPFNEGLVTPALLEALTGSSAGAIKVRSSEIHTVLQQLFGGLQDGKEYPADYAGPIDNRGQFMPPNLRDVLP
jgi:hypothetical protein